MFGGREIGPEKTQVFANTETEYIAERNRRHELLCQKFNAFLIDLDELPVSRTFQIKERLGRGRQGVVFKVINEGYFRCQTRHAVKFFDPSLFAGNRDYDVAMLQIARQVSVLQQLYHPNLVQCESFHEHEHIGILLMELIEGLDIRNLMNHRVHQALKGMIPEAEWEHYNSVIFSPENHGIQPGIAFHITRKILRGLEVLHRTGYIHCDIKPSNVMIDRFGTIKLIDFGRATQITDPGDQFLASPMYMAPEMHRRENITPQADVYSCGMVLLEMLHGGHVIDSYASEEEILQFKLELPGNVGDFLPPKLRRNKEMIRILRTLLAVDLDERYASADEADGGSTGAYIIHRQLTKADLDVEYGLELEMYLSHRIPRSRVLPRRKLRTL